MTKRKTRFQKQETFLKQFCIKLKKCTEPIMGSAIQQNLDATKYDYRSVTVAKLQRYLNKSRKERFKIYKAGKRQNKSKTRK